VLLPPCETAWSKAAPSVSKIVTRTGLPSREILHWSPAFFVNAVAQHGAQSVDVWISYLWKGIFCFRLSGGQKVKQSLWLATAVTPKPNEKALLEKGLLIF
jgi:hypothetical protein